MFQVTLKSDVVISGVGLHSGKEVVMKITPAKENTGIVFRRVDVKQNRDIPAIYSNVTDTKLCTLISNEHDVKVGTIEHLMSALYYLQIDNAIVEVNSHELPVLDGSSHIFLEKINEVGLQSQLELKKQLRIVKPISLTTSKWTVGFEPHDTFSLDVTIDFDNKVIGKQSYQFDFSNSEYVKDISFARTFTLFQEIEYLKSLGLALGGSLDNAVVVSDDRVLNPSGLRYKDEFVRHKLLDAVGDLYLSGYRICGHFTGVKCGHDANNKLLREVFKDKDSYSIEPIES